MKTITIELQLADTIDTSSYATRSLRRAVKDPEVGGVLSRLSQPLRESFNEGRQSDLEMILRTIAAKVIEAEQ